MSVRSHATGALLAIVSVTVCAESAAPGALQLRQAVEGRKAVYTLTAQNFAPLAAMQLGKAPFVAAEALKRAERVAFLAHLAEDAYPTWSQEPASRARPAVWREWDDFSSRLNGFAGRAEALAAQLRRAPQGDESFRTAVAALAKDCRSCHDTYRAD